jgi:6-phosphogluconolactonase
MTLTKQTIGFYIGAYTDNQLPVEHRSQGIYHAQLDLASGAITRVRPVAAGVNACFLVLAPDHRFLYAVADTFAAEQNLGGVVGAFAISGADGELRLLNQTPAPGGRPSHVTIDATGRFVVTIHYGQGSVALYPVQADGAVAAASHVVQHRGSGPNPTRQAGPHAHQATFAPDNRLVLVNDLGIDKVLLYQLDRAQARLIAHDPPWATVRPGAGPRHLAFHPNGDYVYVIGELDATITAFRYDAATGVLRVFQVVPTLPADFHGENLCADIHVHPSGRFLYGSNRGHDSIAIFAINQHTGELTPHGHQSSLGQTPRNFAIDPTGAYLLAANQKSGTIATFHIDPKDGGLTPTGHVATTPAPSCLKPLSLRK